MHFLFKFHLKKNTWIHIAFLLRVLSMKSLKQQQLVTEGCTVDEFTCDNSLCIPSHRKCDGKRDCSNGEDESFRVCFPSEFASSASSFISIHFMHFIHSSVWNLFPLYPLHAKQHSKQIYSNRCLCFQKKKKFFNNRWMPTRRMAMFKWWLHSFISILWRWVNLKQFVLHSIVFMQFFLPLLLGRYDCRDYSDERLCSKYFTWVRFQFILAAFSNFISKFILHFKQKKN